MIDFSGDVLYDRVRYAGMAELADAQDLGSCEIIRVGFGAALKLRSAPLLLLSNSNPLRWASSWFLVRDDSLHLLYQHMTKLYCPKMQAKSTA